MEISRSVFNFAFGKKLRNSKINFWREKTQNILNSKVCLRYGI